MIKIIAVVKNKRFLVIMNTPSPLLPLEIKNNLLDCLGGSLWKSKKHGKPWASVFFIN